MASHSSLNTSSSRFFVSVEYPFLGASPDGLIECECCGLGVVEVKWPLCAEKSSIEEVTETQKNFALKHALMAVYN